MEESMLVDFISRLDLAHTDLKHILKEIQKYDKACYEEKAMLEQILERIQILSTKFKVYHQLSKQIRK